MSASSPDLTMVLSARELRIGYDAHAVLDGINIAVPEGQVTAITGRTGSGKSTLLHVLGLLAKPLAGEVMFCPEPGQVGVSYASLSRGAANRVIREKYAYVFQRAELVDYWNASTNISLPLLSRGYSKSRRAMIIRDLCERLMLDLTKIDERSVARLSGGERQRVGIARALAPQPRVVFADEPFGSLDRHTSDEVTDLFFNAVRRQGVAGVLVSHDAASVRRCDREYRIDGKTLIQIR